MSLETLIQEHQKSNVKMVYFSYPYTRDPRGTTEEVKVRVRQILKKYPNIIPIIPHLVFDALHDFPNGYSTLFEDGMGVAEIEVISRCDLFVYDPNNKSSGVRWEICVAKYFGVPVTTYDDLLATGVTGINTHDIDEGLLHLWLVKKTLHPTMSIFQIRKEHVPIVYAQMKDAVDHNIGYRLCIRNMRAWIALIKHDSRAIYAPPYEVKIGFSSTKKSLLSGYDWRKGYGSGSRGRWNAIELGLPVSDIIALEQYAKKVREMGIHVESCI